MDRRKLAAFATSAALSLLVVILCGAVLAIGDRVFQWDVVPEAADRAGTAPAAPRDVKPKEDPMPGTRTETRVSSDGL